MSDQENQNDQNNSGKTVTLEDIVPQGFTAEHAVNQLWEQGDLFWKLHEAQLDIYQAYTKANTQKFVINCSRRLGKSTLLCLIALEYAIKNPNSRICYAAPTQKMVKNIIEPIMRWLLLDCPEHIKPTFKVKDQKYEFPNGAEICLAGTDSERVENLRGQSMHLGICDEAGFMSQLNYVVSDVLLPQTLTTKGRIIIASTPPKTPAHDFTTYAIDAETRGYYIKKTIYDNPLIDKKTIVQFMLSSDPNIDEKQAWEYVKKRSGPPKSSTWRREWMAEFVTEGDMAVIPEATEEKMAEDIIKEVPRPEFFDSYVVMDVGFNDYTAVLFGYWDFLHGRIVIEDEVVMNKINTLELVTAIRAKEEQLWGVKKPYMRYADTDPIIINDLQALHNLTFTATARDNLEAQINNLRLMVANSQIAIHPRCKHLISHVKMAIWNKNRTSFERSGEYGHFDALAALIYFCRNVQRFKNPIPPGHGTSIYTQFIPADATKRDVETNLKKVFNINKFFNRDK